MYEYEQLIKIYDTMVLYIKFVLFLFRSNKFKIL